MQDPDDLTLRRRVKELENQQLDIVQAVAVESDDVSLTQKEDIVSRTENTLVDDVGELQQLQDSEPEDNISDSVSVTLNRWLSNIQRRRENV